MEKLHEKSRAIIEFELEWKSKDAKHIDRYWADPVNFWRDYLGQSLYSSLLGKEEDDKATVAIPRELFHAPYTEDKLIRIRPSQFKKRMRNGGIISPVIGQFYPQGFLKGVNGVFKQSIKPCRFIGHDDDFLLFDLNHPLGLYDLKLHATVREIHEAAVERGGRCEDWLEKISDDGPGMQAIPANGYGDLFTENNFQRQDDEQDQLFYRNPRFVHHLDSLARNTISDIYRSVIKSGDEVLDIMGSWDSHIPDDIQLKRLAVLGLNKEELLKNTKATDTLVQNLNTQKALPYDDDSFDAVICTASVEYLIDPVSIFQEVNRVLKDDGFFALTFSNRWFPPKVIKIWTEIHEFERLGFVLEIFRKAGNFTDLHTYSRRGLPRPDDDPHQEFMLSDPVYVVWGRKG